MLENDRNLLDQTNLKDFVVFEVEVSFLHSFLTLNFTFVF